jgi:hypothetical protein
MRRTVLSTIWSRNGSVSIVTRLRLNNRGSIPDRKRVSFFYRPALEVHPASYTMGTRGLFSWG